MTGTPTKGPVAPYDIGLMYRMMLPPSTFDMSDSLKGINRMTVAPNSPMHGFDVFQNLLIERAYMVFGGSFGLSFGSGTVQSADLDLSPLGYDQTALKFAPGQGPNVQLTDLRGRFVLGARVPVSTFAFSGGLGVGGDMLIAKAGDDKSIINGTLSFPLWVRADYKPVCELSIGVFADYAIRAVGLFGYPSLGLGVAYQSCPPPPPPPRTPRHPPTEVATYTFGWQVPASPPAPAVELTVAVVDPAFVGGALGTDNYKRLAKSFAASMSTDFDRALVAKGIHVSGPFSAINEMTYSDKQSADLALTPIVFVSITQRDDPSTFVGSQGVADYVEKVIHLKIDAYVAYEMKEPLSQQKLWVKKLDLPSADITTVQAFAVDTVQVPSPAGGSTTEYRNTHKLVYDGRQDAIAKLAGDWYPMVMSKAWTYLDTAEMLVLKKQVEEIRGKKVY